MNRSSRIIAAVAAAFLLLAGVADAHGISSDAASRTTLEFVPLGIKHMLMGWDHLLFIAGVVILAGSARTAAKLISCFVAGHSLTLLVATLAAWRLDAGLVDVVIALSVVFVGVVGLRFGQAAPGLVMGGVFAFGLVHGLGLSTRLQALGLPQDGLVWRVLAFNLGVEIGQILAIAVMVGAGLLITRVGAPVRLRHAAQGALIVTGLIAAMALSFPAVEGGSSKAAVRKVGRTCTQAGNAPRGRLDPQARHPARPFYAPGDRVPERDVRHVIRDGIIVIRYRPQLAETRRSTLVGLSKRNPYTVIAPGRQQVAVRVITARRQLSCGALEPTVIRKFADVWIADVQAGRVQP